MLERAERRAKGDAAEVGFEFQRLHGMGEALYGELARIAPQVACRTYAPVGGHRDLLAYLVRRLLENGANSSFVSLAADKDVPAETLIERPRLRVGDPAKAVNAHLPLPRDLYGPSRKNSSGSNSAIAKVSRPSFPPRARRQGKGSAPPRSSTASNGTARRVP